MSSRKIFKEEQRIEGRNRAEETRKVKKRKLDLQATNATFVLIYFRCFFHLSPLCNNIEMLTSPNPGILCINGKVSLRQVHRHLNHVFTNGGYSRDKVCLVELS